MWCTWTSLLPFHSSKTYSCFRTEISNMRVKHSIFPVDTALSYFTLQWTCKRPASLTQTMLFFTRYWWLRSLQLTLTEVCTGKNLCPCLWPVPFKNTLGRSGSDLCMWDKFFFFSPYSAVCDLRYAYIYFRIVTKEIRKKLRPLERPCSDTRLVFLTGPLYMFSPNIVVSVQQLRALPTMCSSTAFARVTELSDVCI